MKTYAKMKETSIPWLGKIPEHWEVKPLFTVLKEKKIRNSGNRINNLLSLSYGQIITKDINSNEGLLPESFETYQIVEDKNIILRLTDLQNDQRSLRVGQVRCKIGIITSAYVCLEGYGLDRDYAFATLFAFDLQKVFYGLGNGVRQSMGFEDLKRLPFPLPPLPEQHAIAAYLDKATAKIDALIAEQEKLCTLLAEKRKALISHVVTKGLNPKAKLKDSGIPWLGDIPEHWDVKSIKHVALKVGSGKTPKGGSEIYSESGIIFLRSQNVHNSGLYLEDVVFISEAIDAEMESTRVYKDDVLLNITGGSIGRACIYPDLGRHANVNQHVCIIRVNHDLCLSKFMHAFWLSVGGQTSIDVFQSGANREGMNFSQINKTVFSLPPLPEQHAIAAYLDKATAKLDALAEKAEEGIALLKERRAALISEVVTGKVRVA